MKKNIKDVALNNVIFLIGVILLTYKSIFFCNVIGLNITQEAVKYTILVALLIMCPTINNKSKFGYIYVNVVYTIITFIIYANFLYYSYSTNFLSFYQIDNIQYANEIRSGVLCIINIKNILMFWVDNILIGLISVLCYKKFEKTVYHNPILKIAFILVILIMNIYVVRSKINDIYIAKIYNKSLFVQNASIYHYHYEDIKDYLSNLFAKEEVNKEKIKQIYNKNLEDKSTITNYTEIAKDYNVIILQLESLNEYIIGKRVNGKEIMPNLNKFFNENIYCSNMYNQGLGTTADSEFEMENSMYPLENGYVFQKYYSNNWSDIYTMLRNSGYYTSFMHPNVSTYWNREEVYNQGYNIEEYNDINSFPDIEVAGEFYSDEGFFEKAVDIMNSYDKKFCTTLVSVTTHIPFYLDGVSNLEDKLTITQEDVLGYKDETFRNYLISCNFVDYAFGKFLEKLTQTGLMDNSILVVYGDHGTGLTGERGIEDLYNENNLKYTSLDDYTKDVHIPFGMKIPKISESSVIERAVSKIDIKPTILDLLGVKDDFSIGDSIFSNKDYSFIKGLGYVTSKNYCINEIYYDRQNMQEIEETEELKNLLEKMKDEIYLSDTIIKNNLLLSK